MYKAYLIIVSSIVLIGAIWMMSSRQSQIDEITDPANVVQEPQDEIETEPEEVSEIKETMTESTKSKPVPQKEVRLIRQKLKKVKREDEATEKKNPYGLSDEEMEVIDEIAEERGYNEKQKREFMVIWQDVKVKTKDFDGPDDDPNEAFFSDPANDDVE